NFFNFQVSYQFAQLHKKTTSKLIYQLANLPIIQLTN
ncbi:unnamed protein product, partial [marine sediment metagenome]